MKRLHRRLVQQVFNFLSDPRDRSIAEGETSDDFLRKTQLPRLH